MRGVILFLATVFLLGFVSAISSLETNVDFTIAGCEYVDGYGDTQVISLDSCSSDGTFFCDSDGASFYTLILGLGCSRGLDSYVRGSGTSCCPSGYACNEDDGSFVCEERTENCLTYTTSSDCVDADCVWMEDDLTCVENVEDYSCDYYKNQTECEADVLNLGRIGVGTDYITNFECGDTTFSISEDDTSCIWDDTLELCSLNYAVGEFMTTGNDDSKSFSCSNTYELGNCTDGEQEVIRSSIVSSSGFGSEGVPEECLEKMGCVDIVTSRFCGEASVKLPGFGVFSFVSSLLIIGVVYLFFRK